MKDPLPVLFVMTVFCGLAAFALIVYFFGKIFFTAILLLFGAGVVIRSLPKKKAPARLPPGNYRIVFDPVSHRYRR